MPLNAREEFIWPVRVYYEDTDSGGVVYYANYLKFMERARTEWLRSLGYEQGRLNKDGIVFAVRRAEVDYLRPARFDDWLEVRNRLSGCGRASIEFTQGIFRGEELLCRGRIKVACLDADTFKPRALPEQMRDNIEQSLFMNIKESR